MENASGEAVLLDFDLAWSDDLSDLAVLDFAALSVLESVESDELAQGGLSQSALDWQPESSSTVALIATSARECERRGEVAVRGGED